MSGLLIVGGSYAGLNIAASARQHGFDGAITMLTEEAFLPYHRPPLSKGYLTGAVDAESLPLRGEVFYRDNQVDVVFGARAEHVEPEGRVVTTKGTFGFDKLAFATGTQARRIPLAGADLDGVVTLRSLADANHIREKLEQTSSVVIIGGGFIGLELAASLAKAGKPVTVLEGLPRVMARVTGPVISNFVERRFAAEGVRILTATGVERIEGDQGKVTGVRDSHDVVHAADLVVMAVGAVPNTGLAEPLGLASGQGIHVDSCGRTANAAMFAAGDCAFGINLFAGRDMRLESVQNATDLGKAAGAAIAGRTMPNLSVPWFWSDQFDLKLQMVGFSQDAQQEVVRGSLEDGKFSVFYLRDERVVGIESVNAVSDHVLGRKLLAVDHHVSAAMLADPSFNPRDLIASKVAAA